MKYNIILKSEISFYQMQLFTFLSVLASISLMMTLYVQNMLL